MAADVTIVGGGLAGCEAAWQLARRGLSVELHEMRPVRQTPVHRTGDLGELVCSNSLRGNALDQAAGLLKEEMRRLGSLVVQVADSVKVPAGSALAVDRALFARRLTETIESLPQVRIRRQEALRIPDDPVTIVATGPLTSDPLAAAVAAFVGREHLHFFDAVSPVVEADSIDLDKAFRAARHGKGGDDYINCPLDEEQYWTFHRALTTAECAALHEFASHWSIVGFQTQLKWGEQKRVFRMIPALEAAEFVRFGVIHRNTYVNAPLTLEPTFETRRRKGLFFAGQMSGVEGYVESAASGLVAGIGAAFRSRHAEPPVFPEATALGALGRYVARGDPERYQPTNIAFGLLPDLPHRVRDKMKKRLALAHRALDTLRRFQADVEAPAGASSAARAAG
jgi:methylenetetrahydrofolate--tRNA-(uracil-5-)-methyltransferase